MEWSAARSKDARKYVDRKFRTRAMMTFDGNYMWHKNFLMRNQE